MMSQQLRFRFLILVIVLFLTANSLFASENFSEDQMPTLRGEKASEYLGKNNLSNSLGEAFRKASNQNSLPDFINFRQTARLFADDVSRGGASGRQVAISGHTAVVGAPKDRNDRGSVYVFVRKKVQNAIVWEPQAKLMAGISKIRDSFGSSVAIEGDTIVVGAPEYDSQKTRNVGTAYVFTRKGDHWAEQLRLRETDKVGQVFGSDVDISGDYIVVSSPVWATGKTIKTPKTSLIDIRALGAIYIYKRDFKGVWKFHQKIFGKDLGVGTLGFRIGIYGKTIVAASTANSKATEPKSCNYSGTKNLVHIFTQDVTKWSLKQTLTPCDYLSKDAFKQGDLKFGFFGLEIDGDPKLGTSIIVDSRDGGEGKERRVFVFNNKKSVANKPNFKKWHLEGIIEPDPTVGNVIMRGGIDISGDKIIIGQTWYLPGSDVVYVYERERSLKGVIWTKRQQIRTLDRSGGPIAQFGEAVAIEKDTVIIGSPGHDRKVPNSNKGAVYVFTPPGIDLKFPNSN